MNKKAENTKFNYIIYHKNCMDGFTGFFLFMKTKLWEPKPIVYPDQPHATLVPPDIDDKNVIIIDVAYNAEIIAQISARANKFLFIDHHITIRDDVKKLQLKPSHEIIYDDGYSGASLVWKYFYGNKKLMPTFVRYIEDNDIGAWKYQETIPFITALEVNFKLEPSFENLKKWDQLLDDAFLDKFIETGKIYGEYKTHLINKFSKKYSLMKFPSKRLAHKFPKLGIPAKYIVAVINGGCPHTSMLGKKIVDTVDCDFCFLWNYDVKRKHFIVSLRSNKTDVGRIAKIMGGGGHRLASAFSFSVKDFRIDDLFMVHWGHAKQTQHNKYNTTQ